MPTLLVSECAQPAKPMNIFNNVRSIMELAVGGKIGPLGGGKGEANTLISNYAKPE